MLDPLLVNALAKYLSAELHGQFDTSLSPYLGMCRLCRTPHGRLSDFELKTFSSLDPLFQAHVCHRTNQASVRL